MFKPRGNLGKPKLTHVFIIRELSHGTYQRLEGDPPVLQQGSEPTWSGGSLVPLGLWGHLEMEPLLGATAAQGPWGSPHGMELWGGQVVHSPGSSPCRAGLEVERTQAHSHSYQTWSKPS